MKAAFEFFKKVEKERWSGEVDVTSSQGHATFLIKNGHLLWAHRPLDRAIERMEKIEWLNLPPSAILSDLKTWESLVKLLISLNSGHYAKLVRYLKTDRLEIFFRIFFWSNVELHPRGFEVEGPDPIEFGFYTPKRLDSLIVEAQRRLQEWPMIQEKMGSSKRVFLARIEIPESETSNADIVDQSLRQFESKPRTVGGSMLPFSTEAIQLIRECTGRNTVEDLIRKSTEGEFLTLRRLLELWKKGAISPKDSEEVVSPHQPQAVRISLKSFASFLGAVAVTLGCLFAYRWCTPLTPSPKAVPLEVTQAIEIYEEMNGHYPLSLLELKELRLVHPAIASKQSVDFDYRLEHSQAYDLKTKSP